MRKKIKVLLLFNSPCAKPRGYDYKEEFADPENMYTENDVHKALKANGYDVTISLSSVKFCILRAPI